MKEYSNWFFIALAVPMTLAPRGWAETGVTAKEILIGSCSDQEGPTKNRGIEQKQAVEAYFNNVNKQGGIHGRKLRLISHDDSYQVEKAPACFETLMNDEVFMGGFFIGSALGVKYAAMAQSHKVPIVGINGGPEYLYTPVKRYVFNIRSSYFDQSEQPVDRLWGDLGIRKIAVAYQNDAYGSAVLEGVGRALKKHDGAAPAAVASFQRPNQSGEIEGLAGVIDVLKRAQPEAVILGGVGAPDARIVQEARAAGVDALFVAVTNDPSFYKKGNAVEGAVMIQPFPPIERKDLPAVTKYGKLLKQSFPNAEPTPVGLEAFIDAEVIVEALRRTGKDLTREGFVDALENFADLDVGLGARTEDKIGFGPNDHRGLKESYATVIRQGKPAMLTDWKQLAPRKP